MKAYAVLMNVKGNKSNHNGEVYKAAPLLCFIFGRDKNESIKVAYDAIVDSIPGAECSIDYVKRLTDKDLKGRCFVQRQIEG